MQKCLLMARMACDSTYLIDQEETEYSSKLERLGELLEGLVEDPTRKIIIFSECGDECWTGSNTASTP